MRPAAVLHSIIFIISPLADGAPYDGAAREQLHTNSLVLVSIYSIAALVGIAFAGFCLVFNIVFRNTG